jgi:opacity protein-like surface antigen
MFTIDFGGGVNIFLRQRQALTLGYRYQHLSNANISAHNPGTDANTFYVGVSRFRPSRGVSSY